MGAIGGLLGLNGGAGGTGFSGPAQADQQGMNNLQDSYQRLLAVSQGNGPNPAMAQYHQNIQNLAKQQAGAISSIQGISPALAARMISQQGSGAMQNAAAQGATMQSQQELGALGESANVAGAQANSANQMQGNINTTNAGLAEKTMGGTYGIVGGLLNAGGKGAAAAAANGGEAGVDFASPAPSGPQSKIGKAISGMMMANGGRVSALVSPGEGWIDPQHVSEVASGKNPMQVMDRFPGKPKVPGNSYANDVLPRNLPVGGVVIPNVIMQGKNPAKGARDMVAEIIAKRKARR